MSLLKIIEFPSIIDERGSLVSIEETTSVPFNIKRVYYLFGTKESTTRGLHAHKVLKQVLLCVKGSCSVTLDDGKVRESLRLNSPNQGLLVGELTWREMSDFSKDCVLVVLASEFYDESDYIRDYDKFKRAANES